MIKETKLHSKRESTTHMQWSAVASHKKLYIVQQNRKHPLAIQACPSFATRILTPSVFLPLPSFTVNQYLMTSAAWNLRKNHQ
jgi:hypothetical protein